MIFKYYNNLALLLYIIITMTEPTLSRLFIRRIDGDKKDLDKNRMEFAQAIQDENNIKIFYFLLKPKDSPYTGGMYIGKIELPDDYPKKPGTFYMLTPNGRFTINSKICLTNSSYHLESWSPIWSIRNMILGFISIFLADDTTGISHIKDTPANRKLMAQESIKFNMTNYPNIFTNFNFFVNLDGTIKSDEEINLIINLNKVKNKKEEIKTVENNTENKTENKLDESKMNETKVNQIKMDEIKMDEKPKKRIVKKVVKKTETKLDETKLDESKLDETKLDETKLDETKINEIKMDEKPKKRIVKKVIKKTVTKLDESNLDESKLDETKINEIKMDDKPKKRIVKKVVKKDS